jgi:phosphate transport system permease protein
MNKKQQANLRKRYRKEKTFKILGLGAIVISLCFLAFLLFSISLKAFPAFFSTEVKLNIYFAQTDIEDENHTSLVRTALKKQFPEIKNRRELLSLYHLLSDGANVELRKFIANNLSIIGKNKELWLTASSDVDQLMKGKISKERLNPIQQELFATLLSEKQLRKSFNWKIFTNGDSTNPEVAGVLTAIIGSFLTMFVFMLMAFPLAVLTALYLEEFAPHNKITDFIEININNLAAIPSIIFGLLGLAIYIGVFGMPRSSPFVGGATLALMVFPTIVISTRNSIKAIPPSIKQGALAMGASPMQVLFSHTLPLALPGIMTGTILAIARAIGETAPLIMIGMVAFIADVPTDIFSPATVMPVQVYLWSNNPGLGFVEKTSAAIVFLLIFLVLINSIAIYIRKKFEQRW